jgi:hypothetical protein
MVVLSVLVGAAALAVPSAADAPDPYADAVDPATTALIVNGNNAVGAPNGTFATVTGVITQSLVLDMGAGEEGTGALVVTYQGVLVDTSTNVDYLDGSHSVITSTTLNLLGHGVDNVFTTTLPYSPSVAATPYRYVRFNGVANVYLLDAITALSHRPDSDNDGLDDVDEPGHGTDPLDPDSDHDGLPDGWEVDHGLDPDSNSGEAGANGDPDHDGLTNAEEYAAGTDPQDYDTDHDGLPDGWELTYGLDPLVALGDDGALGDPDGDGLSNAQEHAMGTNPIVANVVLYLPISWGD